MEYSQLTMLLVSGRQQSNSAIHIHVSNLSQTPLPSRLPHNIEQRTLHYTVGPCWLCILNIAVFFQLFLFSLFLFNFLTHCWVYFYQFILQNFKHLWKNNDLGTIPLNIVCCSTVFFCLLRYSWHNNIMFQVYNTVIHNF